MTIEPGSTLGILIPAGPGETGWRDLVDHLRKSGARSILLSAAETPETCPRGVTVVTGPAGRGRQLNRGARATDSDWLWFLHADSRLQDSSLARVEAFMRRYRAALGYCRLRFHGDGPRLTRLNALGANLRSRLFGLPYGDQGLCLPRVWFQHLGGFDETLERGEDLDLVVRAHTAGLPIQPVGTTITTSARRYREEGWWHTTWHHQVAAWRLIRDARKKARSKRTI